jgi:hypothetical protein
VNCFEKTHSQARRQMEKKDTKKEKKFVKTNKKA